MTAHHSGQQIAICLFVAVTVFALYSLTSLLSSGPDEIEEGSFRSTWIHRLVLNLVGYSTILIPGYLVFRYVKLTDYSDRLGGGFLGKIIHACLVGKGELPDVNEVNSDNSSRTLRQDALLLSFCFIGLQGSYLTWGILQEKIMTQKYQNSLGQEGSFKDSQFLVFAGKLLAFILSGTYLILKRQPRHTSMPLYKYAYCSFSNIMSSWCQYEALKYISFPSQVLAKACKIIPVMMMGKLVSKHKYEYYEYVTAALISIGMTFFMLSSAPSEDNTVTTLSGIVLLISYLTFDSFTSNWQGYLFSQYKVSPVQMMWGVNLFSLLFTSVSLFQQGAFSVCIGFMNKFPKFGLDVLLLAISSGAGQLFIFSTISFYGPVVFVIIMTIRQGLAILLSCLIYQHTVTLIGIIGIIMVFTAIFLRIYCSQPSDGRNVRKKEL
ncbi:adenosine 3'-phospho 5'-phosphosulfate transporter [Nesidiocoris tenuis]|uniref:Adenosine 3'-phospho 5'-phosphosulfate transporter 1 n=1 Tax=Nesidiocoris tenuis TaxID=355587 RepID=A0ABN7ASC8_9HEMI|nr:adenosine 3'-phospho 5'-phosphosulfate transporter [Nesidiocoris tenuis]